MIRPCSIKTKYRVRRLEIQLMFNILNLEQSNKRRHIITIGMVVGGYIFRALAIIDVLTEYV